MRLMGIDPGLRRAGWGIISVEGSHLRHVAHGTIVSDTKFALAERLCQLYLELNKVLELWQPAEAAIEESFVNKNPSSTLKLGQARGVLLLAPAVTGVPVFEYAPNLIKKSIVVTGHAQKKQVSMMVSTLLPDAGRASSDAADALAVAICHAHLRLSQRIISDAEQKKSLGRVLK